MSTSSLRLVMIALVVFLTTPATGYSTETADAQGKTAIAHFPVSHYRFDTVLDGTDVIYDFIVQNKGTAPLNITNVRTG